MAGNLIEFAIGLNAKDFNQGVENMNRSVAGFGPKFAEGMASGNREVVGTREKVEILRHSLDQMGGSLGSLGNLARMALDPMTVGFAAVFAGVELLNKSLEAAAKRMEEFQKSAIGVENIVKGIIEARPTGSQEWIELLHAIQEAGKSGQSSFLEGLAGFSSRSDELQEGMDTNKGDATQQQLELEQQKIELLRQAGQISAADAATRIEALKDEMTLQKNIAEQKIIKDKISGKQSDLREINRRAQQNPVEAAAAKKQQADATVNDLQKQIIDLPKAIQGNEKLRKEAEEKAKGFYLNPKEKFKWQEQAENLGSRNAALSGQLEKAKVQLPGAVTQQTQAAQGFNDAEGYRNRGKELNSQIAGLNTQLSVTKDRQSRMTPIEMEKHRQEALAKQLKAEQNMESPHKVDATTFEKMGFVMGRQSPMKRSEDLLQQIVANTSRSNQPPPPPTGNTNAV